ncbi:HNH endonuclease [Arthrobacter phage PeggyLeg03]|nr:HNH endonuclease [Arthrobacter phage PeggyLeg03]
MPSAPRKPCPTAGCPELIPATQRRCPTHATQHEQARGSRTQRGYDATHDALRKQWAPQVATGAVRCARCRKPILAGTPWDLGHTGDRTTWTGPEHAACNRRAGGRATKHRGHRR